MEELAQRVTSVNHRAPSKQMQNQRDLLWLFLLLSLCAHIPFFVLSEYTVSKPKQDIALVFVENYPKKQIVFQNDFNHLPPKKDTPYMSKADKRVDRQTRAMLTGLFYQADWENSSLASKKKFSSTNNRRISSIPPALMKKIEAPLQLSISASDQNGNVDQKANYSLSQTMDFLLDVEPGANTLLNTRAFKYYSYFSRMKTQLYSRWMQYFQQKPIHLFIIKLPQSHRSQQLFSTHLYALLSPDGELQDLRVSKSSGETYVDEAALHAFLSAVPFPNTPKDLVAKDGYVHIHQKFHLHIYGLTNPLSPPRNRSFGHRM